MSGVRPADFTPKPPRLLRSEETALVRHLGGEHSRKWDLADALVEDVEDGDMGSIRFLSCDEREPEFTTDFADCEYVDSDGVEVLITLEVDEEQYPVELDLWKVDFKPLRRYPTVEETRGLRVRKLR